MEADVNAEFGAKGPAVPLNIGQGLMAIDMGLAFAEQVEVRAVEDENEAAHGVLRMLPFF